MYYLYTVGLSLSGKTWLVNKIKESFPKRFVFVETRAIHEMLNTIDAFKDDNSVGGESYEMRQEFTVEVRKVLISMLAKKGFNIISDSGNQVRKDRVERIKVVKNAIEGVKTILIYVNTPREITFQRAKEEDEKLEKAGYVRTWVDLHNKQLEKFEEPTPDEADYYIEYDGSNWKSIIAKLKEIIKN